METSLSKSLLSLLSIEIHTVLLATVVCLFLTLIMQHRRSSRCVNLPPPGTRTWPLIGSIPYLLGDNIHRLLGKMANEHGPVFTIFLGHKPIVVLNDYKSIRQAFAKSGDDMCSRPGANGRNVGLVLTSVTQAQKEQRRFALQSLRSLGMGRNCLEGQIAEEIGYLTESLESYKSQPFDPYTCITRSVSNVICTISFGQRFQYDDNEFNQMLGFLTYVFGRTSSFASFLETLPVIRYIVLKVRSLRGKTYQNMDILYNILKTSKEKHHQNLNSRSYVGMFMEYMMKINPENKEDVSSFNETNLRENVTDFFFAGTETTSNSVRWALLIAIIHPDIQAAVQEELDRVVGRHRMPGLFDRTSLPYTEAFLMELSRVASVVSIGVPHSALTDTKLFDYDIPKGTMIISNIWGVHHDPDIWDEPDKFKPERFLDKNNNTKIIRREELIPFCLGRRRCLGEQLAVMETYLMVTHLLHRFTFKIPDGAATPTMEGRVGITHSPLPFELCAISR